VQASPNPEYASQPSNYAHWLLAHLFPLMSSTLTSDLHEHDLTRANFLISHGANAVLPMWAPRYAELFDASCMRGPDDASGGRFRGYSCNIRLNVSVAAYAFCRRAFWNPDRLRRVSAYLRQRLLLSSQPAFSIMAAENKHRLLILERRGTDGKRGFYGLDRACDAGFGALAVQRGILKEDATVDCSNFNMSMSLAEMARAVGAPGLLALVSGHGAGLANVLFMRAGASMAEFDAVKNIGKARNFYQYLSQGIGVRSTKVWLNASGARFCPPRVNACGGGNLNMYRASVLISEAVLMEVIREVTAESSLPLRDCGVARDEEGSKMYRAKPRQSGWGLLEMAPWPGRIHVPDTTNFAPKALGSSSIDR